MQRGLVSCCPARLNNQRTHVREGRRLLFARAARGTRRSLATEPGQSEMESALRQRAAIEQSQYATSSDLPQETQSISDTALANYHARTHIRKCSPTVPRHRHTNAKDQNKRLRDTARKLQLIISHQTSSPTLHRPPTSHLSFSSHHKPTWATPPLFGTLQTPVIYSVSVKAFTSFLLTSQQHIYGVPPRWSVVLRNEVESYSLSEQDLAMTDVLSGRLNWLGPATCSSDGRLDPSPTDSRF